MDKGRITQLLARIGRHDQAALRELYKAFSLKVYAYVMMMCNDAERAEEILVETMFEVWREPARFAPEGRFAVLLVGRARAKLLLGDGRRELADPTAAAQLPGIDLSASASAREAAQSTSFVHLQPCLQTLPGEHRECLHLVFFDAFALPDVAGLQQCSDTTVKLRLVQANQQLRDCMSAAAQAGGAGGGRR